MGDAKVRTQYFEQYRFDEYTQAETDELIGFRVFSQVDVGERTRVRAVAESVTPRPVSPKRKAWFVEWQVVLPDGSHWTHRLTPVGHETTLEDALSVARVAATKIDNEVLASETQIRAFFGWSR